MKRNNFENYKLDETLLNCLDDLNNDVVVDEHMTKVENRNCLIPKAFLEILDEVNGTDKIMKMESTQKDEILTNNVEVDGVEDEHINSNSQTGPVQADEIKYDNLDEPDVKREIKNETKTGCYEVFKLDVSHQLLKDIESKLISLFEKDEQSKISTKITSLLGPDRPDAQRVQLKLDQAVNMVPEISHVDVLMRDHMSKIYPQHVLMNGSLLASLPGGQKQGFHTDFSPNYNKIKSTTPYSILLPISEFSCLDICDSLSPDFFYRKVTIPRGEVLLFNGFAVHRGMAYTRLNFRLHWFLQHKDEFIRTIGCDVYPIFDPILKLKNI